MSSALVCWKSLHWPQECHSISKKLSLLIRDQMAAGGLSSYFQQAPRRCGLLIPSLEASLNHVTDDTPGLGNLIIFFFFFWTVLFHQSVWLHLYFSSLTLVDAGQMQVWGLICAFHLLPRLISSVLHSIYLIFEDVSTCTVLAMLRFYLCVCVQLCGSVCSKLPEITQKCHHTQV